MKSLLNKEKHAQCSQESYIHRRHNAYLLRKWLFNNKASAGKAIGYKETLGALPKDQSIHIISSVILSQLWGCIAWWVYVSVAPPSAMTLRAEMSYLWVPHSTESGTQQKFLAFNWMGPGTKFPTQQILEKLLRLSLVKCDIYSALDCTCLWILWPLKNHLDQEQGRKRNGGLLLCWKDRVSVSGDGESSGDGWWWWLHYCEQT